MTDRASPATAKKSFHDGCVTIGLRLKCHGYGSGHATIDAGADLTIDEARTLARNLMDLADKADAKIVAKIAAEARRKKWRDREIAAGRMVVLGRLA